MDQTHTLQLRHAARNVCWCVRGQDYKQLTGNDPGNNNNKNNNKNNNNNIMMAGEGYQKVCVSPYTMRHE